ARGGAAVEFALVLPLFMALVMGALDYGWFFFSSQVVTNAAREGARAATLANAGDSSAATSNAKSVALAYMTGNGVHCTPPDNSPADKCITPTTCCPTCSNGPACSGLPSGTAAVDVVIRFRMNSLTGFTSIILPQYVYGHSIMRW